LTFSLSDNGRETLLEVNHLIPAAEGGRTVAENLQTLCDECNRGRSPFSQDRKAVKGMGSHLKEKAGISISMKRGSATRRGSERYRKA
jgi:hypothetical protein